MKALPKSVKIGPVIYEVKEDPRLFSAGMYGQLVRTDGVIELLPDVNPILLEVTLWHEIIHEILEQIGVKAEESVMNRLAYGVTGVLHDNPELSQ